ncbi:DUF4893 domain-containing protein [Phyllobacterium myrsinacearum]|uniref:DUF4893 domain-containing protein n=1 Tax=Phyllobacterium myrsinacearum TaxID=28101 RepID=A0A839EMA9_9HYPH|nr:DUF4893 domain-containing protein [Phyllobacterium myrsinacearum]MBA8878596.1 hypothetical protein [Phyllobacterium myrsinacearum]
MLFRTFFLATIGLSTVSAAHADGAITKIITAADSKRLEQYQQTKTKAVAEAKATGAAADVRLVDDLLNKPGLPFSQDFDMTGNWQCRTIKLGGMAPALIVYGWFKCKVTDDGSGWALEKISGSQRTKGRFYTESDTRLTYLGTGYVSDQKPVKYGAGPKTDEAGYAYRTGKNAFRIELPAPYYESLLNVMEFRR